MESVEEIVKKAHIESPPTKEETLRLKPGQKIYSRNPITYVVEEGWRVIGIDEKKGIVHLEKETPNGLATRNQAEKELVEINMQFAKMNPGEPSKAVNPENKEERDALYKGIDETLR